MLLRLKNFPNACYQLIVPSKTEKFQLYPLEMSANEQQSTVRQATTVALKAIANFGLIIANILYSVATRSIHFVANLRSKNVDSSKLEQQMQSIEPISQKKFPNPLQTPSTSDELKNK